MLLDFGANLADSSGMGSRWKRKLPRKLRALRTLMAAVMVFSLYSSVAVGVVKADAFTDVPEAVDYSVVYTLAIPDAATNFNANPAPYSVDLSGTVDFPFDRVAYHLELQSTGNPRYFVYVSVDAFTGDATRIGVPTLPSGAFFQQALAEMNVVSNAPGIVTGTDLAGGWIEFWPNNYAPTNAAGAPNASDAVYDFGDQPSGPIAGYGSMQIHNTEAEQTLFAYNRWGLADTSDLGIGNSPGGHPDWTFEQSAGQYTVKNLQILVRPASLALTAPGPYAVFQRQADGKADVPVTMTYADGVTRIEFRAVPMAGFTGVATDWQSVDVGPGGGTFSTQSSLFGGWYRIEIRAWSGDTLVSERATPRVGVGEVFVTTGQSNSANHGLPALCPEDERVSAWGPGGWRFGKDPQPIATGSGGSPWPPLGDELVEQLDVPVGFISVGWGGTRVDEWLPGGTLYPRLADALQLLGPGGLRSVLWHQGESDTIANTTTSEYAERLSTIIAESRLDAGFDVPWGIALVSFVPPTSAEVLAGQEQVIAQDPLVFLGAETDDLIGVTWRHDGIHFNEAGLREHARRWLTAINAAFDFDLPGPRSLPGDCNRDAVLDLSDAVCALGVLFTGMPSLFPCGDGTPTDPGNLALMDWQPDGSIDLSDVVAMLQFLFFSANAHALAVPGRETTECVALPGHCEDTPACPPPTD